MTILCPNPSGRFSNGCLSISKLGFAPYVDSDPFPTDETRAGAEIDPSVSRLEPRERRSGPLCFCGETGRRELGGAEADCSWPPCVSPEGPSSGVSISSRLLLLIANGLGYRLSSFLLFGTTLHSGSVSIWGAANEGGPPLNSSAGSAGDAISSGVVTSDKWLRCPLRLPPRRCDGLETGLAMPVSRPDDAGVLRGGVRYMSSVVEPETDVPL